MKTLYYSLHSYIIELIGITLLIPIKGAAFAP